MISQGWEVEGKARRVIMTLAWRNKSYYRRDLDRTIFQVKEDVHEGSTKHPTFRTIPKVVDNGRASHYVHERRCWKGSPPTWRRDRHYFAYCWLYDQKGVGGPWKFGGHLILLCFPTNESWTRSTSSSKFTLGRIWRDKVQPVGTVTLPVVVEAYPQQIAKEVNFLVVDCSSPYNAIIGRLTLNSWKVLTSTYHFSIKFPTNYGVGQVQGDQLIARECHLAMLAMDEHV